MNVVYLGLGGNIGDVKNTMEIAFTQIKVEVGKIIACSSLYETEPWGIANQQNYLNTCICIETKLRSAELITMLLSIESQLGRKREEGKRDESRTMDIDILFFNDEMIQNAQLEVPHPRLHLRKFVLIPLCEIASSFRHPVLNQTVSQLLKECKDESEVKKVEGWNPKIQ